MQENSEEKDIFVPPQYVGDAIDGDTVQVELLDERPRRGGRGGRSQPDKGPAGKVVKILERKRSVIVGELIAGRKVRPLNRRLPDIDIKGSLDDAKRGDWIEVEAPAIAEERNSSIAPVSFVKALGKAGTVEADIEAVLTEFDLKPAYTEEEDREAAAIKPVETKREDLTSLFVVTIDPIDAKDFDDAVSLAPGKKKGELELGIHIADLSAWITPGSTYDKKAEERSFTAYIPGNTLPMIPKTLTRTASLTAEAPSPAHTVLITVEEATGKVLRSRRCFSTIKVNARLTFEQVQAAIDGNPPDDWDDELKENVAKVAKLTRTMRAFRKKTEQFIELATTEIRVICNDETKEVEGLKIKHQTEADMLVEECMLAANVEVAKEMNSRKIPGLYRIHPEPDEEKLLEFSTFVNSTFGLTTGDLSSRTACNHFLTNLPDDHIKPVIIDAFLRSMMRATYLEEPALHYGLGKGNYSHFTSPIRRYPDLIVHQQLRAADSGGKLRSFEQIAKFAKSCSEKEIVIDQAYYAANDRLKLHYIKQKMFDGELSLLEGVIRNLTSAGLMVDIAAMGISGFVPIELLPGDAKKRGDAIVASRGHDHYKCGDFIFLQLEKIDMVRGSAIFRPAGV
jgi:ribonuclease R